MLLSLDEAELFFKLHRALMFFVNQRLKVLPGTIRDADEFSGLSPEQRLQVRDAFLDEMDLIEKFIDENPNDFTVDELEIVKSWHELVAGDFFIFRYLKKYAVFLSSERLSGCLRCVGSDTAVRGACRSLLASDDQHSSAAISRQAHLRWLARRLPGLVRRGHSASLKETYESAKQRLGIVTSLPVIDVPGPALNAAKPKKKHLNLPQSGEANEVLGLIVDMTDQFCREHLNDEYAVLCRKLAEKLARKRPSPLLSGKPNTWACGIVRTIGLVNFLDDRSQNPHMKLTAIDRGFGVGESTGQGKSKLIRNLLKIRQFDHEWTLPSRMDENPLIWMLEVNGFMQDIRDCPREAQEIAFEKGIIPYIPADRANRE